MPIHSDQLVRYLDFLEAKVELLNNGAPPQSVEWWKTKFSRHRDAHIQGKHKLTKAGLKSMEADLEEMLGPCDPDPAERREIDRQLMERFGFTRIGADPAAVTRRVLKRGHIKTLEELEVVRTLIANQGNIETLGAETYDQLALLLDTKEAEGME